MTPSLSFPILLLSNATPDGLKPPKGGKSPRGLARQQPRSGKQPLEGGHVRTQTQSAVIPFNSPDVYIGLCGGRGGGASRSCIGDRSVMGWSLHTGGAGIAVLHLQSLCVRVHRVMIASWQVARFLYVSWSQAFCIILAFPFSFHFLPITSPPLLFTSNPFPSPSPPLQIWATPVWSQPKTPSSWWCVSGARQESYPRLSLATSVRWCSFKLCMAMYTYIERTDYFLLYFVFCLLVTYLPTYIPSPLLRMAAI